MPRIEEETVSEELKMEFLTVSPDIQKACIDLALNLQEQRNLDKEAIENKLKKEKCHYNLIKNREILSDINKII